jgi:hypothetical protein
LSLLLALVLLDYGGRFADDPRLAVARDALPAQLERARKRVAVDEPVRLRLEDLGNRRPGPVARTTRDADGFVIVLYAEPLLLRAHDPESTLAHELVHVLQKRRWGALRGMTMPPWVVEGMAVHRSGQLEARARALAAHVGRDKEPADAAARLVNGLGGRHTLLDYFEDGAAFAAVQERHGREKFDRFVGLLLDGRTPSEAAARALGETMRKFEDRSRAYALEKIRPLIRKGRGAVLALRAAVEERRLEQFSDLPAPPGVYVLDGVYYRALGRERQGKIREALEPLRKRFLGKPVRDSTLLVPALELEARLLKALGQEPPKRPELDPYRK